MDMTDGYDGYCKPGQHRSLHIKYKFKSVTLQRRQVLFNKNVKNDLFSPFVNFDEKFRRIRNLNVPTYLNNGEKRGRI